MIEKLAYFLAKKMVAATAKNSKDSDDIEVLAYGFECIFNMLVPFICFLVYSVWNHIYVEMLCCLVAFLFLRNYIGGYHASSHIKCLIYSTVYGCIVLYLLSHIHGIPWIFKITSYILFLFLTVLLSPILRNDVSDYDLIYIKHIKRNAYITLSIQCLLCLSLSVFIPSIGDAIFYGSFSSIVLFVIEKLTHKTCSTGRK